MRFFKAALAALAVFATPSLGALTPQQMADNLKLLTDKSQALQAPAQTISLINTPLILIGQGPFPIIINGFTEIIGIVNTANSQMTGTAPVTAPADATLIADAFREFVRVHQVLLNILIGKAGILVQVPFVGAPVAAVLRQLEAAVDTVALQLIDLLDSQNTDVQTQANSLGGTLDLAIQKYDGLNIQKRHARDFSA
ncbi:hypothetical protein ABW19_dt0204660 [Dactylella cylindrospora]|nr:hypothetical protein ABW19_dt0204660 [Dactylella cylindrospora]